MNIDIIKSSIKRWSQLRNTDMALTFLTSGFGLEIHREEYEKWEEIVKGDRTSSIHLYIGVLEFETVFYVTDAISDAKEDYRLNENLFYKSFTKENTGNVTHIPDSLHSELPELEAMQRAFKWFSYADRWFTNKMNIVGSSNEGTEVVQAFTIPYGDLIDIFKDPENSKALLFFGLKDYYNEQKELILKNEIEVLLCSENKGFTGYKESSENVFEDVSIPRPPFSTKEQNLNLLKII